MIHILLLILKIIGIILLAILILALLVLGFPIKYTGKGSFDENSFRGSLTAYWLFHIVHFSVKLHGSNVNYALRVFGIPVFSSKEKKKGRSEKEHQDTSSDLPENVPKEKHQIQTPIPQIKETDNSDTEKTMHNRMDNSDTEKTMHNRTDDSGTEKTAYSKTDNPDAEKTTDDRKKETQADEKIKKKRLKEKAGRIIKKIKKLFKDSVNNTKSAYDKIKEIKTFITANTTKEAYNYGKVLIIKFVKHIFPKKITAEIHLGFEEPHITGQILGYFAMIYGILGINPEKVVICPDFEKKVFHGKVKFKGHVIVGIAGTYVLKFYFKKEIHDIIKQFSS